VATPPDAAPAPAPTPTPTPTPTAAIDAGAAVVAEAPPDAAVEQEAEPEPTPEPTPTPTPTPPAAGQCQVAFSSTPPEAAVVIGGKKRGKTPVTLTLPCTRATAVFERPRYTNQSKGFTPREGKTVKVSARLERPTFTIKVISSPGGASVVVDGHAAGKTPATVKVPGFQAVTVKVSKPGYQSKTTKVTAKKNGNVVNVSLRRGN